MTKRTRSTLPPPRPGTLPPPWRGRPPAARPAALQAPGWGRIETCPVPTDPAEPRREAPVPGVPQGVPAAGQGASTPPDPYRNWTWNAPGPGSHGGKAPPTANGWSARSRPAGRVRPTSARAASPPSCPARHTWWSGRRTTSSARPRAWRSGATGIRTAGPRAATVTAERLRTRPAPEVSLSWRA